MVCLKTKDCSNIVPEYCMRIDMCDQAGRQSVDELGGMTATNGMARQVRQASVKKLLFIQFQN
jgi:hypothetical protein